jgi:hypothetical protein
MDQDFACYGLEGSDMEIRRHLTQFLILDERYVYVFLMEIVGQYT